jgi:hypothetical protein
MKDRSFDAPPSVSQPPVATPEKQVQPETVESTREKIELIRASIAELGIELIRRNETYPFKAISEAALTTMREDEEAGYLPDGALSADQLIEAFTGKEFRLDMGSDARFLSVCAVPAALEAVLPEDDLDETARKNQILFAHSVFIRDLDIDEQTHPELALFATLQRTYKALQERLKILERAAKGK